MAFYPGRGGVPFQFSHTWAIPDAIAASDILPRMFVPVRAGTTVKIVAVRYMVEVGTSVNFKLTQNGADIAGFTNLTATTTPTTTDPNDVTLADLDQIRPVINSVVGNPQVLSISVFMEITA